MSEFDSINWGDLMKASGGALEPIPRGKYSVIVDDCSAGGSSTGKLMYKVKFKVEGGPYNGRILYNNITLTMDNPNALRMFFLNMKALGLTSEFFAQNPAPGTVADVLRGQRCIAEVDHRLYQGQMRENVKGIMPPITGVNVGGINTFGPGGPSMVPSGPQIPSPGTIPPAGSTPAIPSPGIPSPAASPTVPGVPNIPAPVNPAPPAAPAPSLPVPENPAHPNNMFEPGSGEPSSEPAAVVPPTVQQQLSDADHAAFLEFQAQKAMREGSAAPAEPATGGPPPMVF